MGNTASSPGRNDQEKSQRKTAVKYLRSEEEEEEEGRQRHQEEQKQYNKNKKETRKLIGFAATEAPGKRDAAEESAAAAAAQPLKQTSVWSLGSLSGRLNWSFTGGTAKNSFHNRNNANRKSFSSVQQQQRRSKSVWHKPLTNSIFSSHFKESSRNDQFGIEQFVAKGAFGVVFKVLDKRTQKQKEKQENQQQQHMRQKYKIATGKGYNNDDSIASSYSLSTQAYQFSALKVLKKSKIIEENSVQQTKEEADIQKLCGHHPFIVQQIDLWQNRRNLHILSEYVPNGEIFSKITHFSIDLIRLYLAEIAIAIDFLHNAGIIYRDAKPENILLTEDYHIKLTDFGLSKWLKLGATTRTMCGTFQYMAPEVLRGEAYGHAADWWSMGVIVCQMFTQQRPDIKPFLEITLPSQLEATSIAVNKNTVDGGTRSVRNNDYLEQRRALYTQTGLESQNFLPPEVAYLPHEAKDVVKRLLQIDPYKRIHSVLSLQRIALYKNFKIEAPHLLNIRPLDIIIKDEITIYNDNLDPNESSKAAKAFHDF